MIELPTVQKEMIEEFQCPGCVCGIDPSSCDKFKLEEAGYFRCSSHVLGTFISPNVGPIVLGLPKGFCRMGHSLKGPYLRLWSDPAKSFGWNDCNVPVWAMEKDGYLFVRTFMPRLNLSVVDVIKGGTLALVPGAIDVSKFIDEID